VEDHTKNQLVQKWNLKTKMIEPIKAKEEYQ